MIPDTVIEDPAWDDLDLAGLAEHATQVTFDQLGLHDFEYCLMGCNDARIAALNADFRGKPLPTNVLSWPSDERGAAVEGGAPVPPDPNDPELGDIAIAYETCMKEAEVAGISAADHCTHLIVHGLLHLLGYDHERDADATLMEGLETQILGKLGITDPYSR